MGSPDNAVIAHTLNLNFYLDPKAFAVPARVRRGAFGMAQEHLGVHLGVLGLRAFAVAPRDGLERTEEASCTRDSVREYE